MVAFVDTSVLVAVLYPESFHLAAVAALRRADARLISALVQIEVASAISKKVRMGEIHRSKGQAILTLLNSQLDEGVFEMVPTSAAGFHQAYEWIVGMNTSLRAADAIHLACAAEHDATLVTADRQLSESAAALGIDYKLVK